MRIHRFDLKRRLIVALTVVALPAAGATTVHDLQDVTRTAKAALTAAAPSASIDITPLDPRVRLPSCALPLSASVSPTSQANLSKTTIRVQCAAPTPWNVAVTAEVTTEMPVVVSTRALRPGQSVSAQDVEIMTRRIPGIGSCCTADLIAVIGQTVRRPIASAEPVRVDALEMPLAIRRGELVTIVASKPGMEIRATGVALADARSGEPVRIRHSSSLRIVQARADTPGVARVDR